MKKLAAILLLMLMAGWSWSLDLTPYELLNSTAIGVSKVLMDRWGAVSVSAGDGQRPG